MATIARWKSHVKSELLEDPTVSSALSKEVVEEHCKAFGHQWRDSFWSPDMTIVTFLLQVLSGAKTLRSGVATMLTQLAERGAACLPSCDPSAYCQARQRLPLAVLESILRSAADAMRSLVTTESGWLGRRVWVFDGSSASMPDTPELQKAFPQPPGQLPGCGFPVVQFVALFCWSTGAVLDLAIDAINRHELPLFRRLWHHFAPGDVVLADRAYCAYADIVRLLEQGVYTVVRLHQRRRADFRKGKRLGHDDSLTTWHRPRQWLPSTGIARDVFDRLPETLTVRLVRITRTPPGFRSRTVVVATTLTDPVETPADEIRTLYRDRWTVELNLRSIKTHLGMEVLRGESVDIVCKEIVMHLLAYNLIRLAMWHAARLHGRDLHRLSFTGTLHRLRGALPLMLFQHSRRKNARMIEFLLLCIASDTIPFRPDRIEPRRVKRRPKQYSLLVKPRSWYRVHRDFGAR